MANDNSSPSKIIDPTGRELSKEAAEIGKRREQQRERERDQGYDY